MKKLLPIVKKGMVIYSMKFKLKKKIIIPLLALLLLLAAVAVGVPIFLYGCNSGRRVEGASAEEHSGMYVDGTVLRNSDGNPFVMRGVNHAHCWYRAFP